MSLLTFRNLFSVLYLLFTLGFNCSEFPNCLTIIQFVILENVFNVLYETRHMPMAAGFLGSNLVKYTVEKGLASGIPNTPLPFMAIGTFYVKSLSVYQAAIAPNRDAIRSDIPNYTNISPVILVSEVVR